jgi:hypothetical protein
MGTYFGFGHLFFAIVLDVIERQPVCFRCALYCVRRALGPLKQPGHDEIKRREEKKSEEREKEGEGRQTERRMCDTVEIVRKKEMVKREGGVNERACARYDRTREREKKERGGERKERNKKIPLTLLSARISERPRFSLFLISNRRKKTNVYHHTKFCGVENR